MPQFELLASGYGSVEGPTVAPDGVLYFSDPIDGGVYRRAPDGSVALIVPKRKGVGGICLHRDGGVVVSGRDLTLVRDGESRILFGREHYQAAGLDPATSFNDIHADDEGRILAGAVWGAAFGNQAQGALVMVEAPGRSRVLYGGVTGCNGLALDWRSGRLYHCATYDRQIIVSEKRGEGYSVVERLSTAEIDGYPDGLALDDEGCLWVAFYQGGAVVRLAPDGRMLGRIEPPAREVTSLCFAGRDEAELIVVTADNLEMPELRGCVFRTKVAAKGAPVGAAAI